MYTAKTQYRKFETNCAKGTARPQSNFHIHVSVSDLYIPSIGLPILLQGKYADHINRSQTQECGNWD